jgi:hypothetical protein
MCDVTMMCSYLWAVYFWVRGLRTHDEGGRFWMLLVAALLVVTATLTKYFGVTLFPLLVAYGLIERRRPGAWLLPLAFSAGLLLAYQFVTQRLYGKGLLWDAVGYAADARWHGGGKLLAAMTSGLTFTGGCCASVALLALVATARRTLLLIPLAVAAALVAALILVDPIHDFPVHDPAGGALRWGMLSQIALWATAGAGLLTMAAAHLCSRRDRHAALLAMWVGGTFCFAVFVNWNVAARSLIPLAPAAAIVAARMWERRQREDRSLTLSPRPLVPLSSSWVPWTALAPAGALAVLLVAADTSLARTGRDAAAQIDHAFSAAPDDQKGNLVFCGHWGFQEYMQRTGARPIDVRRTTLMPGDVYLQPDNNTRTIGVAGGCAKLLATLEFQPISFVSTMRPQLAAGFYSDVWGPLPFAFGTVPPERYKVLLIEQPVTPRGQ